LSDSVPFGRYRLVSLLGEGGMARVYKAVLSGQMGFEKKVALKRIPRAVTQDERMLRALINEARLGGQLTHKNIVETYEFDDVGGHYYLAMEFVDGFTLADVLQACRENRHWMPTSVVVEIFDNIMKGLVYAHELVDDQGNEQKLVHRDLKPGNIIVSRAGDVKVMDFGIAKAESNLYKTTDSNATKGTPVYMSPEQVRAKDLDQRSDIFSMGSVLHEMLTLQVPFQGENLVSIVHGILETDLTQPLARVQARCPELVPIVEKMMARDAEGRFESSRAVRLALRGVREKLRPGPTLADWLEEINAELPPSIPNGEFGDDGPPRPVPDAASRTPDTPKPKRSGGSDNGGQKRRRKTNSGASTKARQAKRRKESSNALPIVFGLAAAGLIGAGVVGVVVMLSGQQGTASSPAAPATAVTNVEEKAPAPMPEPTPEPTPQPAPKPAPKPAPRVAAPAPRAPTPAPELEPEPTPEAVVSVDPGYLDLNSRPWSKVKIDGKEIGTVPIKRHAVPPGPHTVTFVCGPCDTPTERTVVINAHSGEVAREVIRFE